MINYKLLNLLKTCILLFSFITTWPAFADLNLNQADTFFNEKNYKQASIYYHRALQNNPNSTIALLGIARCHIKNGHYEMAQDKISTVLSLESNNTDALYLQSEQYLRKKEYESAKVMLQNLINLDPNYIEAYSLLSGALYNLGDNVGSDEIYELSKTKQAIK